MNRFAAIADVHGNYPALEAVLSDISSCGGIESVVNLGDSVSGPLQARQTADKLISLNMRGVRGNHDRWLIDNRPHRKQSWEFPADQQLNDNHRRWLAELPATMLIDGEIFLCHGTPCCDNTYWTESVRPDGTVAMASLAEIKSRAGDCLYPLMLCGHTHLPRVVQLDNGSLLVNPGSIGCPAYTDVRPVLHTVQAGNTFASYAVLQRRAQGWEVSFRQVVYDRSIAIDLARDAGDGDWVSALSTGWIDT